MPRVLVVDDSVTVREAIAIDLVEQGWQVECVENAIKAMTRLTSAVFDVVVCDPNTPGVSGFKLCRWLREELKQQTPFILLCRAGHRQTRFWATRIGANEVVDKTQIRDLPSVLDSWVQQTHSKTRLSIATDMKMLRARMDHVMEDTWFEKTLFCELQKVLIQQVDLKSLFCKLSNFLASLVEYQWFSLQVYTPNRVSTFVQTHENTAADSIRNVALATGCALAQIQVVYHEQCVEARLAGPVLEYAISYKDHVLGKLFISLHTKIHEAETQELLHWLSQELSPFLPLVTHSLPRNFQTGFVEQSRIFESIAHHLKFQSSLKSPVFSLVLIEINQYTTLESKERLRSVHSLLRHVSATINSFTQGQCMVAQTSRSRWCLLMPNTRSLSTHLICERIRTAMTTERLQIQNEQVSEDTISIATATYEDGESIEEFLIRAERLLQLAQQQDKSQHQLTRKKREFILNRAHPLEGEVS